MLRCHLDTDQLPTDARWPSWRQNLSEFAIDADGAAGPSFDGRIRTCTAPSGLSFTLVESAAPQTMAAAKDPAGDVFWLSASLSGSSVLELDGKRIDMVPGDILYGKQGAPCSLEISTGFRMLLVNIPAAILARKVLVPLPTRAILLSGRTGIGRIFSGLLASIAGLIDELDDTLTGPIEAALPQFLLTSLFGEGGEAALAGNAAVRAGVLQRVWQTIESHLDDVDLSIARVAALNGLSVRYVQKLFEEGGQNFSRYVRRRRLEQCRADLANPLNRHVPITTTSFRWGFNDSATFSRAFREEFGVSPREFRRAQGQAAPPGARRPTPRWPADRRADA
jgi:AraC-like DNA-binding protein